MIERQVDGAPVAFVHALEEPFADADRSGHDAGGRRLFVGRLQPARAEHRHDRHGHEQRHRQREHHDERQLREQDAGRARQEQQRHEHGDVRQRRGQNRRPHFLAAVDGRGHPVLAHVQVAVRVLEHDDRRVDDHADAEREAAEGHRVQREAAEVEQRERADDRDRNRGADDQRRAEVAQEREDDQHDEHAADQRVLLHVVDRALDEDRVVLRDDHLDAGHFLVDALDLLAHGRGDFDRVLARLLLHLDLHARLAVDPHERAALLGGVLHLGDVAHVDRHALAGHDDEVPDVLEALELALAADQERRVALVDLAERRVLVLLPQRR